MATNPVGQDPNTLNPEIPTAPTYGPETVTSVANLLPGIPEGSPVVANSGLSSLTPWGAVKDTVVEVGKGVNEHLLQSKDIGVSQDQTTTPAINLEELQQSNKELMGSKPKTQEAQTKIGDIQRQEGTKAYQEAYNTIKKVQEQREADQVKARADANATRNTLLTAEEAIGAWREAAKKNPADKVWKEMVVDRPIMSTIGFILGGVGAGLTGGQNAYTSMLNKQMDIAVENRAKELEIMFKEVDALRGVAESRTHSIQTGAIAQNLAQIQAYTGAKEAVAYQQERINSIVAPEKAQVLNNMLDFKLQEAQNNLGKNFLDFGAFSNTENRTLGASYVIKAVQGLTGSKPYVQDIEAANGIDFTPGITRPTPRIEDLTIEKNFRGRENPPSTDRKPLENPKYSQDSDYFKKVLKDKPGSEITGKIKNEGGTLREYKSGTGTPVKETKGKSYKDKLAEKYGEDK